MTRYKALITRKVFDLDDQFVLDQECWKVLSNNTLKHYKKEELIGIIRCLEHNWAGEIKTNMLLRKRLENFYNYYKEKGQDKLFNQICDDLGSDKE